MEEAKEAVARSHTAFATTSDPDLFVKFERFVVQNLTALRLVHDNSPGRCPICWQSLPPQVRQLKGLSAVPEPHCNEGS